MRQRSASEASEGERPRLWLPTPAPPTPAVRPAVTGAGGAPAARELSQSSGRGVLSEPGGAVGKICRRNHSGAVTSSRTRNFYLSSTYANVIDLKYFNDSIETLSFLCCYLFQEGNVKCDRLLSYFMSTNWMFCHAVQHCRCSIVMFSKK